MKKLFFMLMLLTGFKASAQNKLSITGKVTGEKQKPVIGATIFLAGTQLVTETDADGKFEIVIPSAGSYHLLVKMLGYDVAGDDVILKDQSVNLNFSLTLKPIALRQVNIGTDADHDYNLAVFEKEFLGNTKNARGCTILNPQVINLSTRRGTLYADADDFLIIENKRLGYRIKYLLRTFEHSTSDNMALGAVLIVVGNNTPSARTAYDGDAIFEELPGTPAQKLKWAHNRLETYKGSMMHFMRAVYNKTVLQEGFITNYLYSGFTYEPGLVNFDALTTSKDSAFVSFKFIGLYITYDPARAIKLSKSKPPSVTLTKSLPVEGNSSSSLIAHKKDGVIIDSRGSIYTGYVVSFLIRGPWTYKRVGDQLPFEYQPPPGKPLSP